MTFNEFVTKALSNDEICITDNAINGKIIEEPIAAFRWIDSKYAEKEIDRFTLIPGENKKNIIAVVLKKQEETNNHN